MGKPWQLETPCSKETLAIISVVFILLVCLWVCIAWCFWRSEDNFGLLGVGSLHCVSFGDWTLVIRLGGSYLANLFLVPLFAVNRGHRWLFLIRMELHRWNFPFCLRQTMNQSNFIRQRLSHKALTPELPDCSFINPLPHSQQQGHSCQSTLHCGYLSLRARSFAPMKWKH